MTVPRPAALVVLVVVAACRPTGDPPSATAPWPSARQTEAPFDGVRAAAGGVPDASAATPEAPFALPELPLTTPPTRGPIRFAGFPSVFVTSGMSDPAAHFGFTRDGAQLGHCELDMCCAEDRSACFLLDRAGKTTILGTPMVADGDPAKVGTRTRAELVRFARDAGLVTLGNEGNATTYAVPKPTGEIAFGGDLTIVFKEIAPSETPSRDDVLASGNVHIGARLEGEEPVFVVIPPLPKHCTERPIVCYEAALNGFVLSPDRTEIGALVFVRNPSHGSTFVPVRITVAAFAARVFDDTGMRHHTQSRFARAAELFTRAVYADPSQGKFAYNLACALARQGDRRAEHALRHAVARGGDALRARAWKDPDLADVRGAPWFEAALAAAP